MVSLTALHAMSTRPLRYLTSAVARALVVTEAAVAKHIANILSKLDLPPAPDDHRRVLAVLAYLRG